jgi:hypothetical protein
MKRFLTLMLATLLALLIARPTLAQAPTPVPGSPEALVAAAILDVMKAGQALGNVGEDNLTDPAAIDRLEAAIGAAQSVVTGLGLIGCYEAYGHVLTAGLDMLALSVDTMRIGDDAATKTFVGTGVYLLTSMAPLVLSRSGCAPVTSLMARSI